MPSYVTNRTQKAFKSKEAF